MPDIAVHSLPAVTPSPSDQMMVVRADTTLALTTATARDGSDGNMWHVDAGDPDSTVGNANDYYLDSSGGWIWYKRSNGWMNTYGNLKGPPGAYMPDILAAIKSATSFKDLKTALITLLEQDTPK